MQRDSDSEDIEVNVGDEHIVETEVPPSKLHEAALNNDADLCSQLISEGEDVNAVDANGQTPLIAALAGPTWNFEAAIVLASSPDADLELVDKEGNTALHHACNDDGLFIFKQLVEACPAALSMFNHVGDAPIHTCVRADARGCVRHLHELGEDIDAKTLGSENTALHLAILLHHMDLAGMLMELGANWSCCNKTGQTVLHYAVTFAKDISIVEMLVNDYKADVNVVDTQGKTPLFLAARNVNCAAEMCALLLDRGSDANAMTDEGQTPILWAGGLGAIRVLADEGKANLTSKSKNGTTVLHGMAHFGDAEAIDFVLERLRSTQQLQGDDGTGLDIDGEAGPDRNTPLHTAVLGANQKVHSGDSYDGHVRVAQLLMAAGADPTRPNAAGDSPAELATKFWLGKMRRELQKAGDGAGRRDEIIDNRKWWQKLMPCLLPH